MLILNVVMLHKPYCGIELQLTHFTCVTVGSVFKSKRKTTGFSNIATFYGGIVNTHKIYRH